MHKPASNLHKISINCINLNKPYRIYAIPGHKTERNESIFFNITPY